MARYVHTPEHAARWSEYRDRWIGHAMRTRPMSDDDRAACRQAVIDMYARAGLPAPRVVFAPSPLVAAMAAGCAAWIWHTATLDATADAATLSATRDATWAAAQAATWAAARDATDAATRDATWAATDAATDAATWAATDAATDAATWAATRDATDAATWAATRDATDAATWARWHVNPDARAICGVACAGLAWRMRQGGNQWAGWPAMAEWLREVAQLPIDWIAWMPWVTLAERSGPRYVHEKFCIISDFPEVLRVDNDNRPHCSTGPFCRWSDGFALYAWHGIRVPAWIIERPSDITVAAIDAESNAEIRRVMIDRFGFARYLREKSATVLDSATDEGGQVMTLYTMPADDDDGRPLVAIHLRNSTSDPDGTVREYVVRVDPRHTSVWAARNDTYQLAADARFEAVS